MVEQFTLYIDSNHQKQHRLRCNLELLKVQLHGASTVKRAREMIQMRYYNFVIMCYDTVGKELFKFCSFVRSKSPHTIMIVCMNKVRIHIEEQLFDLGVNNVVVGKQASVKLLTKRIETYFSKENPFKYKNNKVQLKDTIIDLERREVRRNGNCCQLRGMMADLLKYFLDNPDRVISREELQESPIWADSICTPAKEGGKTFDVNIGKLRKVIETDPSRPEIIKSVRGVGWKLATSFVP